jgi:GNAT superfamily N-acetyltransferase
MRIEVATLQEVPLVVDLLALQFEEHRIALSRERLTEAVRVLISDPSRGVILVAYAPQPIGIAVLSYTWTVEHGGSVAWLDELFVVTEHRRRGVGRGLLQRALDAARAAGCQAVELEVDKEHARAEALYRREGFSSLPRRRWSLRLASSA